MTSRWKEIVKKIDDYRWEIPTSYKEGMSVPGRIFASGSILALTSFSVRLVRTSLTPQLISKPTPPGDTTPSLTRVAATPPMGKP